MTCEASAFPVVEQWVVEAFQYVDVAADPWVEEACQCVDVEVPVAD